EGKEVTEPPAAHGSGHVEPPTHGSRGGPSPGGSDPSVARPPPSRLRGGPELCVPPLPAVCLFRDRPVRSREEVSVAPYGGLSAPWSGMTSQAGSHRSPGGAGPAAYQRSVRCRAARASSRRRTGVVTGAAWSSSGSSCASREAWGRASPKHSRESLVSVSVGSTIRASSTTSGK